MKKIELKDEHYAIIARIVNSPTFNVPAASARWFVELQEIFKEEKPTIKEVKKDG